MRSIRPSLRDALEDATSSIHELVTGAVSSPVPASLRAVGSARLTLVTHGTCGPTQTTKTRTRRYSSPDAQVLFFALSAVMVAFDVSERGYVNMAMTLVEHIAQILLCGSSMSSLLPCHTDPYVPRAAQFSVRAAASS